MARKAALNFHAGPLPEFGGWAFYNIAILEDSPEYGCTCHHMDEGFDTGPLLEVRRFPIVASQETAVSLERKTQEEMIRLFVDFCSLAESGEPLPCNKQDSKKSRYLTREEFQYMKRIPANADAETIDRYARAFWYPPYECAYTVLNNTRVEVVPTIARKQLAITLHKDDFISLRSTVEQHKANKRMQK
jgi:methionyl-tRNA formyltransferase